jgi:hypothetical protein
VATDDSAQTGTSTPVLIAIRLDGDGNNDGAVDGLDYGVWQAGYGNGMPGRSAATFETGDYNGDGLVDGEDYGVWQADYGHTTDSESGCGRVDADGGHTG